MAFGKVYYASIASDLSNSKTEAVLSALNDSPALDIFKVRPIQKITFTRTMPSGENGFYTFWNNHIHIGTARKPDTYGRPFEPGRSWSISTTGSDKVEAIGRTLIHETGHHLQAIGGIEVEKIAVAAFRSPDRKPITGYAKQAWFEYLAETWAAYHVEKDNLKAFDPVGVKMIDDILRKIREILGT